MPAVNQVALLQLGPFYALTIMCYNNQVELHPCYPQNELLRFCHSKGIQLTAYCPLGQYNSPFFTDPMLLQAAEELSKTLSKNVSVSQLVLSWAVQRGTIVIPKSANETRLKQNIDVGFVEYFQGFC